MNTRLRGLKTVSVAALLASGALVAVGVYNPAGAIELAQAEVDTERTLEQQQREREQLDARPISEAPLSREVTYQEVLQDPDNIELNFLYARTQIAKGRLPAAVAPLERILASAPELVYVRLLYATLLFRLDNMEEAEIQFNQLKENGLSPAQTAEVDKFLQEIALRRKTTNFVATLGVGAHFDTNKNSAPSSGDVLLNDVLLDTNVEEQDDAGLMALASVEMRHDLGMQQPHEVYGKVSAFVDRQSEQEALDVLSPSVEAGVVLALDAANVDVSVNYSQLDLGEEYYMYATGGKLRVSRIEGQWMPYFEQRVKDSVYQNYAGNESNDNRSGQRYDTRVGTRYALSQTSNIDVSLSYTKNDVKQAYHAFSGYGASLVYTHAFDKGVFVMPQLSYDHEEYKAADTFVSVRKREDDRYRVRVTLGAPIGAVSGAEILPEQMQDIMVTGSAEYYEAQSNLENYDNKNWRGELMLTKKIRF